MTQLYLDLLNEKLKEIDLPQHRSTVDRSGNNLSWLRKHVGPNHKTDELGRLISMTIADLLKPVVLMSNGAGGTMGSGTPEVSVGADPRSTIKYE